MAEADPCPEVGAVVISTEVDVVVVPPSGVAEADPVGAVVISPEASGVVEADPCPEVGAAEVDVGVVSLGVAEADPCPLELESEDWKQPDFSVNFKKNAMKATREMKAVM